MLPAPTSVTAAGALDTVTDLLPTPAAPSLSVTVTRSTFVPAAAYVCAAPMGLDWLVTLPVVAGEPSPQSIEYAQGASFTPGSPKLALSAKALPAVAVCLTPAFTTGPAFAMVAVV